MDFKGYDEHTLSRFRMFFDSMRANDQSPIFQLDNSLCHKYRLIRENLESFKIPTIPWPLYSPDLDLIEHVYSRIKHFV